ncbi:MAG TPA: hypothetical protein DCO75_01795 [Fibrobacteres bacterium]|nr:hypothetical protein [Fibrobacterota bacterium]
MAGEIFVEITYKIMVRHAPFIGEIFAVRFSMAMRTITYPFENIFLSEMLPIMTFGLKINGD